MEVIWCLTKLFIFVFCTKSYKKFTNKIGDSLNKISYRINKYIYPHSTLYPMDVQRMSFWDIAITIIYPEWSQLSTGYAGDVQGMSTCVRSYGRNGNVLKYHMEMRNMLLFHYYIMKMNYFK